MNRRPLNPKPHRIDGSKVRRGSAAVNHRSDIDCDTFASIFHETLDRRADPTQDRTLVQHATDCLACEKWMAGWQRTSQALAGDRRTDHSLSAQNSRRRSLSLALAMAASFAVAAVGTSFVIKRGVTRSFVGASRNDAEASMETTLMETTSKQIASTSTRRLDHLDISEVRYREAVYAAGVASRDLQSAVEPWQRSIEQAVNLLVVGGLDRHTEVRTLQMDGIESDQ